MKSFLQYLEVQNLTNTPIGNAANNPVATPAAAETEATRSQIRMHLRRISRRTGNDYEPLLAVLKNDRHLLGLFDELIKNLATMSAGTGKALAGQMR